MRSANGFTLSVNAVMLCILWLICGVSIAQDASIKTPKIAQETVPIASDTDLDKILNAIARRYPNLVIVVEDWPLPSKGGNRIITPFPSSSEREELISIGNAFDYEVKVQGDYCFFRKRFSRDDDLLQISLNETIAILTDLRVLIERFSPDYTNDNLMRSFETLSFWYSLTDEQKLKIAPDDKRKKGAPLQDGLKAGSFSEAQRVILRRLTLDNYLRGVKNTIGESSNIIGRISAAETTIALAENSDATIFCRTPIKGKDSPKAIEFSVRERASDEKTLLPTPGPTLVAYGSERREAKTLGVFAAENPGTFFADDEIRHKRAGMYSVRKVTHEEAIRALAEIHGLRLVRDKEKMRVMRRRPVGISRGEDIARAIVALLPPAAVRASFVPLAQEYRAKMRARSDGLFRSVDEFRQFQKRQNTLWATFWETPNRRRNEAITQLALRLKARREKDPMGSVRVSQLTETENQLLANILFWEAMDKIKRMLGDPPPYIADFETHCLVVGEVAPLSASDKTEMFWLSFYSLQGDKRLLEGISFIPIDSPLYERWKVKPSDKTSRDVQTPPKE